MKQRAAADKLVQEMAAKRLAKPGKKEQQSSKKK